MIMFRYLLTFLFHLLHYAESSDVIYLLQTENSYYCLTNSSSAMYFTDYKDNILEDKTESQSDFAHSDYNWKVVSSLDYDRLPVFDQRWTNLSTESITRVDMKKNKMLDFRHFPKTFSNDENNNAKITFSIRANEFEFLLCSSTDVANSFCYWFLMGFNRTVILRMCDHKITVIEGQEPIDSCKQPFKQGYFHLSDRKWTHIKLERKKETFLLKHIDNGQEKIILEYSDVIRHEMYYFLIHTEDDKAFYKLHKYYYLRTKSLNSIEMKNTLHVIDGKVCCSLFYTTCQQCEIKIYLIYVEENGKRIQISSKETLPPSFGNWKHMRLRISPYKNFSQDNAYIALHGHLTHPNVSNPFWAIGSFEECQKSEYRKSTYQNGIKSCQLVSNDDRVEWTHTAEQETCQCSNDPDQPCFACNINGRLGIEGALLKLCQKGNGRQRCCKFNANEEKTAFPLANFRVEWNKNNTIVFIWKCIKLNGCIGMNSQIEINENAVQSTTMSHRFEDRKCGETFYYKVKKIYPSSSQLNFRITVFIDAQKQVFDAKEYSYPEIPELVNSTISVIDAQKNTIRFQLNITEKTQQKPNTSKYMFILIADPEEIYVDKNFMKLKNILNETIKETCCIKVIAEINLLDDNHELFDFTIGNGSAVSSRVLNETLHNSPLKGRPSEIIILLTNQYRKKYSSKLYPCSLEKMKMLAPTSRSQTEEEDGKVIYVVLLTLFGVCVIGMLIVIIIVYRRKINGDHSNFQFMPMDELNKVEVGEGETNVENFPSDRRGAHAKLSQDLPESRNFPKQLDIIHSKLVRLSEFEEYMKRSLEYKELERQHELFPRGQIHSCKYGSLDVNKHKNRYENLITYDHSRVVLGKIEYDEYSDYINASYIHGYEITNAYIATQGPKKDTTQDFWRMIWQENVNYIIMIGNILENGKEKIHQYWPSKGDIKFGGIVVQIQSVMEFAEFEQRIFYLTHEYETRKLEQIHFTAWPDQGIPLYPHTLRSFVEKIVTIPLTSASPVVVHCSAGVGRTGTILLIDICLRMAAEEESVDFLHILQKLRQQRPNMVDNEEQYKLAHLVVLDYVFGLRTSIPCDKLDEKLEEILNNTNSLRIQFDFLKNCEWQDEAMKSVAEIADNYIIPPEKNRFGHIVPERRYVELSRYPSDDPSSTYINAVRVDGIKCPEKFIVTQQPMPNTLGDFWRLILEMRSEIIISLNEINPHDETCCKFWPTAEDPEIRPEDFIVIVFKKRVRFSQYDIYSLHIISKQVLEMEVKVIALKGWKAEANLPLSCDDFFSFWQDADSLSRHSRNVIVTCFDGATASGVYVALSSVIEKMRIDKQCDVCTAVRNVRHNRKQFVKDHNQLIFLYGAALIYNIKCFS